MAREHAARVVLMRHGESAGEGLCGWLDHPLTERGQAQMRAAAMGMELGGISASPLRRCHDFARDLAGAQHCALHVDPDWREMHFGRWEGIPLADIDRDDGARLGAFWQDPECHPPPGGERLDRFRARVLRAWRRLRAAHGAAHLVVTHGGVIRVLLCEATGRPLRELLRWQVPHAATFDMRMASDGAPRLQAML